MVDFNVAKFVDDEVLTMHTPGAGTLAFAAPERLNDCGKGYTEKVDVWAAGILLVMLLIGQHPFSQAMNGSTSALIQQILNGEAIVKDLISSNDSISSEVKDLLANLVRLDPEARLSASDALKHSWFDKHFSEHSHLGSAQENMAKRKLLKQNDPDHYYKEEGFSMQNVTKEILRYGLETRKSNYGRHHSVIIDAEELAEMMDSMPGLMKVQSTQHHNKYDVRRSSRTFMYEQRPVIKDFDYFAANAQEQDKLSNQSNDSEKETPDKSPETGLPTPKFWGLGD